jgi:hypothetical protein
VRKLYAARGENAVAARAQLRGNDRAGAHGGALEAISSPLSIYLIYKGKIRRSDASQARESGEMAAGFPRCAVHASHRSARGRCTPPPPATEARHQKQQFRANSDPEAEKAQLRVITLLVGLRAPFSALMAGSHPGPVAQPRNGAPSQASLARLQGSLARRANQFAFTEIMSSPKNKNISLYRNSDLRY